ASRSAALAPSRSIEDAGSAWSASTSTVSFCTSTKPPETNHAWVVAPSRTVSGPGERLERNGLWPGRTPKRPSAAGTTTSSAGVEISLRSGVTMSTFSLAIGHSLLEGEPQGLRLDGLELHLVPIVHPGLLARHAEHALEPDESPVQLPELPVGALREKLVERPPLDDAPQPVIENRDDHRTVAIEGRLLRRRLLLGLAHGDGPRRRRNRLRQRGQHPEPLPRVADEVQVVHRSHTARQG